MLEDVAVVRSLGHREDGYELRYREGCAWADERLLVDVGGCLVGNYGRGMTERDMRM